MSFDEVAKKKVENSRRSKRNPDMFLDTAQSRFNVGKFLFKHFKANLHDGDSFNA
jgi:hypothetical protein